MTLLFPGGPVDTSAFPDRTAAEDRQAQHDMALEFRRLADGIAGLLDDTEPAHSSDRDQRGAA